MLMSEVVAGGSKNPTNSCEEMQKFEKNLLGKKKQNAGVRWK